MKPVFKKTISWLLVVTLMLSMVPTMSSVFAAESDGQTPGEIPITAGDPWLDSVDIPQEIRDAVDSGEYVLFDPLPVTEEVQNGAFFYIGSQNIQFSENSDKKYLMMVGRGGSAGDEASIAVQITDVSAVYGENYTMGVFGEEDAEILVSEDHSSYVQTLMNAVALEETPIMSEEEVQALAEELEAEQAAQDALDSAIPEQTEGEETTLTGSSTNPLAAARDRYTGKDSTRPSAVDSTSDPASDEATPEPEVLTPEQQQAMANEVAEEKAAKVDLTLTFAPGETQKYLIFTPKYSSAGDGDGIFNLTLQAPSAGYQVCGEIGGTYGIVVDENPDGGAEVYFAQSSVTATGDAAEIVVKRKGRMNENVSVTIYTLGDTAVTGDDFSGMNAQLVFPMGVDTRTIQLPVNHNYDEEVSFELGINDPKGCAIGEQNKMQVVIAPYADYEAYLFELYGVSAEAEEEESDAEESDGEDILMPLDFGDWVEPRVIHHPDTHLDAPLSVTSPKWKSDYAYATSAQDTGEDFGAEWCFTLDGVKAPYAYEEIDSDRNLWKRNYTKLYAIYEYTPGYHSGFRIDWEMCKKSVWARCVVHWGINVYGHNTTPKTWLFEVDHKKEVGAYYHRDKEKRPNNRKTKGEDIFIPASAIRHQYLEFWMANYDEDWVSNCGSRTRIWGIQPILRNFEIGLKPTTLEFKGTTPEEASKYTAVEFVGSNPTRCKTYASQPVTVKATDTTNTARLKSLWLVSDDGRYRVKIKDNPDNSRSMTFVLDKAFVSKYFQYITFTDKSTPDEYKRLGAAALATFSIEPEFEYYPASLTVRSNPYGHFDGFKFDGESRSYPGYHIGDRITLSTVCNPNVASYMSGTGYQYVKKLNSGSEQRSGHEDYGSQHNITITLNDAENTITPIITENDNALIVRVDKALVDAGRFDTTFGVFSYPKVDNKAGGTYDYTIVPAGKLRPNTIASVYAKATRYSDVPVWKEPGNATRYGGAAFYHTLSANTPDNVITLSLQTPTRLCEYTVSGKLYNSVLNLTTQREDTENLFAAAKGALFVLGGGVGIADENGSFELEPFRAAPGLSMRYLLMNGGVTVVKEFYCPSGWSSYDLNLGALSVPSQSFESVRVQEVFVQKILKDYANRISWLIPMDGEKTKLNAVVADGQEYTLDGKTFTEQVTGVNFIFVDSDKRAYKAVFKATDMGNGLWTADMDRMTPDKPGDYSYGDNLYIQLVTDRKISTTAEDDSTVYTAGAGYAPISTGYSVVADPTFMSKDLIIDVDISADVLGTAEEMNEGNSGASTMALQEDKPKKKHFAKLPFIGALNSMLSPIGVKPATNIPTQGGTMTNATNSGMLDDSFVDQDEDNIPDTGFGDEKGSQNQWYASFSVTVEMRANGTMRLKAGIAFSKMSDKKRNAADYRRQGVSSIGELLSTTLTSPLEGSTSSTSSAMDKIKNINATLGGPYYTFGFGFGLYIDFGLVSEGDPDDPFEAFDSEFVLMGGGIYLQGNISIGLTYYIVVPVGPIVIPFYAGGTLFANGVLNIGVSANPEQYLLYDDISEDEKELADFVAFELDILMAVGGSFYLGCGLADILGVKGSITLNMALIHEPTVKLFYPDCSIAGLRINAVVGGQVDLLFISIPFSLFGWDLYSSGYFKYFDERYDGEYATPGTLLSLQNGEEAPSGQYRLHKRAEGAKWVANEGLSLQSTFAPDGETVLAEDGYDAPAAQLLDIGEGRTLMVWLEDDGTRSDDQITALMYSVRDQNGVWSAPQVVQNDGTGDFYPNLCDAGDNVMISWTSSDPDVAAEASTDFQRLLNAEIYTTLFNKNTLEIGDITQLTDDHELTYGDHGQFTGYMDTKPTGIYDSTTSGMAIYYLKTAPDTEATLLDVVNPMSKMNYSVITYRLYDKATGTWMTTYFPNETPADGVVPGPEWYGQRFIDTQVSFRDPTDESVIITLTDPLITDFCAAPGYNGLGVYAYTVDLDRDVETTYDREIFVQVYDFLTHKTYYPIRLTEDEYTDVLPQLVRTDDATYLFWAKNNSRIAYINVTNLIKYGVNNDGTLKDEDAAFTEAEMADPNNEDMVKNSDASIHYIYLSTGGDDKGNLEDYRAIVDNDNNVYIVYPQATVAEGADGKQYMSREIHAVGLVRDAEAEANWSRPNQLTYSGRVNDDLALAVDEDGRLTIVANRYSMAVNVEQEDDPDPIQIGDVKLVAYSLRPSGSVAVTGCYASFEGMAPVAGDMLQVSANVRNDGLSTANGYTVSFYESKNGIRATTSPPTPATTSCPRTAPKPSLST